MTKLSEFTGTGANGVVADMQSGDRLYLDRGGVSKAINYELFDDHQSIAASTDWDTLSVPGVYRVADLVNYTNAPDSAVYYRWGVLRISVANANTIMQEYSSHQHGQRLYRMKYDGLLWSPWALVSEQRGVFTPTLYGVTTAGAPAYSNQSGSYSISGKTLRFRFRITLTSKGGMAGSIRSDISVLPYQPAEITAISIVPLNGLATVSGDSVYAFVQGNDVIMRILNTSTSAEPQDSDITDAFDLLVAGSYIFN